MTTNEALSAQQIRVDRAAVAVDAYRILAGWGSDEENISDLLADLMHYVDHLKLDKDALLETAQRNYEEEVMENNA